MTNQHQPLVAFIHRTFEMTIETEPYIGKPYIRTLPLLPKYHLQGAFMGKAKILMVPQDAPVRVFCENKRTTCSALQAAKELDKLLGPTLLAPATKEGVDFGVYLPYGEA